MHSFTMAMLSIQDKIKWNQIISSHLKSQFLQSWEWGEFQKAVGRKVWRLGVEDNGKLVDAVQVIRHDLPFGKSYLYVPRAVTSHWSLVTRELVKIAKSENCIFIKIEPVNQLSITCPESDRRINYQLSTTKPVQPQTTLYLDLTKSEEQILSAMHQKTRYNIHLAEKHGVTVKESNNIEEFLKLNRETAKRDQFKPHSDEYYRKMHKVLGNYQLSIINYQSSCCVKLFSAYYNGQTIASNIVAFFADTASYIHGASSNEHRNVMAPHLLQWETIKYAKSQGYQWYDFWGIMPIAMRMDANFYKGWEGITRFKQGFVSDVTGEEVTYPGCFDLPMSKFWYTIYKTMRFLKR